MVVILSQTESGGWQLVYQVILELWRLLYYLGRKSGRKRGAMHIRTYICTYRKGPYVLHTLNHAIARCMQTISYPEAQIQQDNGH